MAEEVYYHLATTWQAGHVPDWWQWRILTLIPKVPGSDAPRDLRPISLLEPMRKVCVMHIASTENPGLLRAHTQHGGRPFRSTESATAQLQNLIDQAAEGHQPLLVALWDIMHAFEPISKNVLRAS